MSKKTAKKVRSVHTEEYTVDEEQSKLPALVRSFLVDGEEYPEDLHQYQYHIKVQRYGRDGKAKAIVGRIFDNLEQLPDELGGLYGSSRFRLFISVLDSNGEKVKGGFIKVENYEIDWAGDPPEEEQYPEEDEGSSSARVQIEIQKMKQAHELQLEMMRQQTAIVTAALSAKGGGGPKISEMLSLINTGIQLGLGNTPTPGDDGTGEGDPLGGISKIIEMANTIKGLMPQQHPPQSAPVVEPATGP